MTDSITVELEVSPSEDPHDYGCVLWSCRGTDYTPEEVVFACFQVGMSVLIGHLDHEREQGIRRTGKVKGAVLEHFIQQSQRNYYYQPGKHDTWWRLAPEDRRKR